jgi:hypothetical protein
MSDAMSAERLAAALIAPVGQSATAYSIRAQQTFSGGLKLLHTTPTRTMADLTDLVQLSWSGAAESRFILRGGKHIFERHPSLAAALQYLDADCCLRSLDFLKASAGSGDFSIADFVRGVDAAPDAVGARPWLFISSSPSRHEELQPLLTCMMDSALHSAATLRANAERRIWLFLDDLTTLNAMPSLIPALWRGRRNGVGVVAGVQDFGKLTDIWGREDGETLPEMFNSVAIFRLADSHSAERAATLLEDPCAEDREDALEDGADRRFDRILSLLRPNDERCYGRQIERQRMVCVIKKLPSMCCCQLRPGISAISVTRLPQSSSEEGPPRHAGCVADDMSDTVFAWRAADVSPFP